LIEDGAGTISSSNLYITFGDNTAQVLMSQQRRWDRCSIC